MKSSNNLENKTPPDKYQRVELVGMNVQALISSKPPLEYNQYQMPLVNQGCLWPFNQFGSYMNIMQFQIGSRKESR